MSNEKISISEMIMKDSLYKKGWFYSFFSTLKKENNGTLVFKDNNFFWKYGIFVKRYFEVPFNNCSEVLDDFINKYLEKDYYVVLYVNIPDEDNNNECCVLFYEIKQLDKKNVYSFCKLKDCRVNYFQGTINDIYKQFMGGENADIIQARFDLLRIDKEEYFQASFDFDIFKRDLYERDKIYFFNVLCYCVNDIVIVEKNIDVLKEWFDMSLSRKKYLDEYIDIGDLNIYENRFKMILASKLNSRLKLIKLLLLYTKVLRKLERSIRNEKTFTM